MEHFFLLGVAHFYRYANNICGLGSCSVTTIPVGGAEGVSLSTGVYRYGDAR